MKFIEKIRNLTKEAGNIECKYPQVAEAIKSCATRGNNYCAMYNLTSEQIEALRAEGFTVDKAPYLFEYFIKW